MNILIVAWLYGANEEVLENARPDIIGFLDTIRNMLIELSQDFGVTDLASGPVIIDQNGLVQKLEKLL